MSKLWRPVLVLAAVLFLPVIGVLLSGPRGVVEVAKARPLIPVVREAQAVDDRARQIALADARVTGALGAGRWEFVDTLHVGGYLPGDLAACAGRDCRQAEFFDFTHNTLVIAAVDLTGGRVVTVDSQPGAVPEANRAITERAQQVALDDARVKAVIGDAPITPNMAPENAFLHNSSCDTPHWCVALTYRVSTRPNTFVVFVDLNENQVAGLTWTPAPPVPAENAPVYKRVDDVCGTTYSYSHNGWTIHYEIQDNDALHVYDVTFNNRPVFQSAKMTQVDVGYAGNSWGFHDSVGCSAIVPPYPSGAAPIVTVQADGFELTQDFRMGGWGGGCAYRYQQWFTFYDDGRVHVNTASFGRGCGTDAHYTPYVRINVGPGGQPGNVFSVYQSNTWTDPPTEGDFVQAASPPVGSDLANWRVLGADNSGYNIVPRWGSSGVSNSQPDNADVIALAFHSGAEGDEPNLPSMGTGYGCPNNCFPMQWADGESIQSADDVLWYVPEAQTIPTPPYYCWTVSTTETYPCYMGPVFQPITLSQMQPRSYLPVIAP